MIDIIAYFGFFLCLGLLITLIADYVTSVIILVARLVGRKSEVRWDFTLYNLFLIVLIALTAFLWHYNFG